MNLEAGYSSSVRRVFAFGYYGFSNFGDELFRETVEFRALQLWPGSQMQSMPAPPSSFLPGHLSRGIRAVRVIQKSLTSDDIAYCGGSLFEAPANVTKFHALMSRYKRLEALGVSVGPFAGARQKSSVISTLQRFDRVVVRDEASLSRSGMRGHWTNGGDLVALHPHMTPRQSDPAGPLVVAPSRAAGVAPESISLLCQSMIDLSEATAVVIASLNAHAVHGDEALSAQVAALIREARPDIQVTTRSLAEIGTVGLINAIASSSFVLAYRLHAAVTAYLSGTPFAIVGHHAKCRDFAADIGLSVTNILPAKAVRVQGAVHSPSVDLAPVDYVARAKAVYLAS